MIPQENETALINAVLHGDKQAFAVLVERYQNFVFTIILKQVNNREVAEELAQDVFVKAYKGLADFKGNSRLGTWLYSIAHFTSISYLRKAKLAQIFPGDDALAGMSDAANEATNGALRMEVAERNKTLADAIARLAPSDGEIINLFYLAEQSVDEIAQITGNSVANVKVKLFRARQKLKGMLEGVL